MNQYRIVPAITVLVLAAAGCGSSGGSGAGAVAAPEPVAAATAAQEAPNQASSSPSLPEDPCALLTPEQVALVLTDPAAGRGAASGSGPGAAASCEWADGADKTFLELTTYGAGADDPSQITAEALLEMRGGANSGLEPLDFGPVAVGGAEDDDAVITWLGPGALYQLRMYSVMDAPDPGTQWGSLQQHLQDLALAVDAAMG